MTAGCQSFSPHAKLHPTSSWREKSGQDHGESIFLSRVEGRESHVEGEGTKSRVEGNIFFPNFFFFWTR